MNPETEIGWEVQIVLEGGRKVFSCWNRTWKEAVEWIGFQAYAGPVDAVTMVEATEEEILGE